ncbi:MAG: CotH kinase family protein [Myxococcales bacterium]|nr:CotH kinase family protein [Myxococcales bacterium]
MSAADYQGESTTTTFALRSLAAATSLMLVGCTAETTAQPNDAAQMSDGGAAADASQSEDAKVDRSHEIYDDAHLMKVDIVISESDWKSLGAQKKSTSMFIKSKGCPSAIPPSPYTYFSAKVTIDGKVFPKVGVRKKGLLGSQSSSRPSLKIKFHEYDPDLRFKGEKRLTLNNNKQDPSRIRTCLAYRMFQRAKVPAPRCTFAKLTINGQEMGIYTNVEPIKKPFLKRHFNEGSGDLYEGTIGDFREQWRGHLEKKTNEDDPQNLGVDKLISALTKPDAKLLGSLAPLLDVDSFIRFWAMEVLLGHFDGYNGNTNNFYAYQDPATQKFTFTAAGSPSAAAFTMRAKGIAPLVVLSKDILVDGKATTLTWEPAKTPSASTISVVFDISYHGGTKGKVVCTTPDSGSLTVPGALLTALIDLGTSGFPKVELTRISAGTTTPAFPVKLIVQARVTQFLSIPGVISCMGQSDCPTDKTCGHDFKCR